MTDTNEYQRERSYTIFEYELSNKKPRIIKIKQHDLEWRLEALEKAGAQNITERIIMKKGFVRYPAEFIVNFRATDEELKLF
jgi:hypothetical protein